MNRTTMTLKKNDINEIRTLDSLAPSLTFLSDGNVYPHNRQTPSSSSSSLVATATAVSDDPVTPLSNTERENEHDPKIDKFATLFTPSAPRASPTLPHVAPQPSSSACRYQVQKERPTVDDSRSFISISTDEDPLSSSVYSSKSSLGALSTFEWDKDDNELLATPVLMPVPALSQPSHQPTRTDNSSLTFFDKFGQDAKRNSELRRKGLVDELLKCDDDPLYFLQNDNESVQKVNEEGQDDRRRTLDNEKQSTSPEIQTSPPSSLPPGDTVLHDVDHDYFLSGRLANTNTHNDNDKTPSAQQHTSSSPTRSPSLPSPPTLAPPIIDSNVSSDLPNPSNKETTRSDTNLPKPISSTFSAKWMSNLLKTSSGSGTYQQQQHGYRATPTLESIFGVADTTSSSPNPPSGNSLPTVGSTTSAAYRRTSSSPPIRYHPTTHPQPHVSHTLPIPASSSFSGDVIKHKVSPFSTHVYIPPSGAPGFKGDSYDWDKGFSNELESEVVRGRSSDKGNENGRSVDANSRGRIHETEMRSHIRSDVKVGIGIGALMEKKSGDLELKGRRAGTTPVLSHNLAILLRPHLPALSRLPRSWTLVYSLDQHGISLNTLYTRCEEAFSPSRAPYPSKTEGVGLGTRGVLLVIRDAGSAAEEDEGVFGAWIADGEGLGMGKKGGKGHFGGGESFLWKFTQGTLKVHKTTGKNNYVALCEPGYISFGGGDGHYGLYLDDTLYDGSSAPCPTFDNEPLCSSGSRKAGTATVEFECVGLEVWSMGP